MKIEICGLNQIYPNGNHALKDILELGTGMFGLLGPNGAGKSSLMRIIVTLMKPTSGVVLVDGLDIQKHREKLRGILGYFLPQDFRFFTALKTWEFLDYSGSLAGMKNRKERIAEVDRLLDQVGLLEVRDRKANKLSGGMKRRLGIAQALIRKSKNNCS